MTSNARLSGAASLTSPKNRLTTVIGAGGKTSLINWLGMKMLPPKKRVILTSTTKIFPLQGVCAILNEDNPDFIPRIIQALDTYGCITVAQRLDAQSGKLIGLSPALVTHLRSLNIADTILVEADGAAHKPLKAPAVHEPVIPLESDICIGVMGLDAAYRPLTEENVHRHTIFSRIAQLAPGEIVTPEHMVRVAMAPNGLFKGSPPDSELTVFLNKSDIPDGDDLIAEFQAILMRESRARNYTWIAGSIADQTMTTMTTRSFREHNFINNRLEFSYQF